MICSCALGGDHRRCAHFVVVWGAWCLAPTCLVFGFEYWVAVVFQYWNEIATLAVERKAVGGLHVGRGSDSGVSTDPRKKVKERHRKREGEREIERGGGGGE